MICDLIRRAWGETDGPARAEAKLRLYRVPAGRMPEHHTGTFPPRGPPPEVPAGDGWHHLALRVAPHEVVASLDGHELYRIPRPTLEFVRDDLLGDYPLPNRLPFTLSRRGGIGLYVLRSAAEFRNATVTPLDE